MCSGCQLFRKHYACVTEILSFVPFLSISVCMSTLGYSVADIGNLASQMDPCDFAHS